MPAASVAVARIRVVVSLGTVTLRPGEANVLAVPTAAVVPVQLVVL